MSTDFEDYEQGDGDHESSFAVEINDFAYSADETEPEPEPTTDDTVALTLGMRIIGQVVDSQSGSRFYRDSVQEVSAVDAERMLSIKRNGHNLFVRAGS